MMFSKIAVALLLPIFVSASVYAQTPGVDSTTPVPIVDSTTPPDTTAPIPPAKSLTTFTTNISLGAMVQSQSQAGSSTFAANWLLGIDSKLYLDGPGVQLGASLYAKYGQANSGDSAPQKTQDDIILSVTPSIPILPVAGIRLFLEVTGETQFAPGVVDTQNTNFLDPLFLYQSLFVGRRFANTSADGFGQFSLVAGVGYAFQQIVTKNFILTQNRNFVVSANSPLSDVQSQVTFESGYSAIADLDYQRTITTDLSIHTSFKTVALSKDGLGGDLTKARVTSLLTVSWQYKFLSLNYTTHLVYDSNVSPERELDQSLVFGLKVDL
jgi:hypothetical protein